MSWLRQAEQLGPLQGGWPPPEDPPLPPLRPPAKHLWDSPFQHPQVACPSPHLLDTQSSILPHTGLSSASRLPLSSSTCTEESRYESDLSLPYRHPSLV